MIPIFLGGVIDILSVFFVLSGFFLGMKKNNIVLYSLSYAYWLGRCIFQDWLTFVYWKICDCKILKDDVLSWFLYRNVYNFFFFSFFPCVFLKEIFFFFFLFLNFMHSSIMIFLNAGKALKKINLNIMLRIWPFSSFSCQMLEYWKGYTGLLSWTGHQLCTVPQGISIWIDTVINMMTWTVILAFHYSVSWRGMTGGDIIVVVFNFQTSLPTYLSIILLVSEYAYLYLYCPLYLSVYLLSSLAVCAAWLVCPMCRCTSWLVGLVCGCTRWSACLVCGCTSRSLSHCTTFWADVNVNQSATFGLFST